LPKIPANPSAKLAFALREETIPQPLSALTAPQARPFFQTPPAMDRGAAWENDGCDRGLTAGKICYIMWEGKVPPHARCKV